MNTCNKCQGKFTWAKPYTGDKVPAGDNPCRCGDGSFISTGDSAKSNPRVEVPIEQICAEIIAVKGTMAGNLDGESDKIVMTEAMIEGIRKFAISRKMSR